MDFPILFEKVSPQLRKMARKLNGRGHFIDEDDLYQEACIHLWNNFKDGVPPTINEAYIVKGCKFHILNYIRKAKDKVILSSLERPINENGETLRDILPGDEEHPREYIDKEIAINEIKGNGLSKREKEVFSLLLTGYTVREVGVQLGISHVMVIKFKKRIIAKCKAK